MNRIITLSILILLAFFSNAQNLLNDPQKIVIDSQHNRYLVSNWGSGGDLVAIDSLGSQSYFVENAGMVDGMHIIGDTVYGSGPYPSGTVRGYDLGTGEMVMNLNILGVQHLSSFVSDSSGFIYTSERFGTRIFKINPKTQEYWIFAEGGGIDEPNGLLYEPEKNRLLVCLDQANTSILAVSLTDSTVSTLKSTNLNGIDGIAKDMFGNYYITGYYLPGIYKFYPDFNGDPEMFFQGANIVYPTYNENNNSLLITYYEADDWGEVFIGNNLLNNPESVVYDESNNRYLVSNCGNGKIIQIDSNGQQSYFNTELTYTLGLHIVGDTLFVSSNEGPYSGIVGFLLSSAEIVFHVDIPEKQLLNDITSDNSGNLYITDCDANKIFKVHMSDMTYSTMIDSGLGYPNGILFDEPNNRLLVLNCLLVGRPILAVDLGNLSLTTVVETGISSIDGLTIDNDGNYYFSSWSQDKVYRYDAAFTNPPEVFTSGHFDPADIFYNRMNNVLAVPNFSADTVEFIPAGSVRVNETPITGQETIELYPNPFSNEVNICFSLTENVHTRLFIYNIEGKIMKELINNELRKGEHQITWNDNDLDPGVYIVSIISGNLCYSKKVIKK